MTTFITFLSEHIANFDIFGAPITLLFRGKEKHGTMRGGLVSLLTYMTFLWFSIELLDRWYSQKNPDILNYQKNAESDGRYYFDENKQRISINFYSRTTLQSEEIDPRSGRIVANRLTSASVAEVKYETEELNLIPCDRNYFKDNNIRDEEQLTKAIEF